MECRMGQTVPLVLYTKSPDRCCHLYEVLHYNTDICDGYARAMFTTESCILVPTAYIFTIREKAQLLLSDL
jgi:hypothetical protein